ncbi:MAG TPA: HAMP domain-containing sensor histidine kinase [Candidatus Saccharimonadales bacterium]
MTKPAKVSFGSRLYQSLIAPKQSEPRLRNKEVVCNILLLGTGGLMACLLLMLVAGYFVAGHTYVVGRIAVCVGALAYLGGLYWLSRTGRYLPSAYLLVLFYLLLALGCVWVWGVNIPFGILLLGIVIVFSGILLEARYSLWTAFIASAGLIFIDMSDNFGWMTYGPSWQKYNAQVGDIVGYAIEFLVLALVSWLFGREVERSLERARHAEAELIKEKGMLEVRVKERTRELRELQIEEMQQMYQFAEVGHLSTALLHDLANYLTVLTLEIGGLNSRKHAAAINRTQHIVEHLDAMVEDVRARVQGRVADRDFDIITKITELSELMHYSATQHGVIVDWLPPRGVEAAPYRGDPFRLTQVITILVGNAIEAYQGSRRPAAERLVRIRLEQNADSYIIRIVDWGKGISGTQRRDLFRPAHSTKKSGMGIGLYLAKQMVQSHFKGSLVLHPDLKVTEFNILLPKK